MFLPVFVCFRLGECTLNCIFIASNAFNRNTVSIVSKMFFPICTILHNQTVKIMLFTGDRARDLPETLTGFLSGPLDSIVMFSICYILKLLLKDQFTLHNCCVTPSHATCLQLELYCVNKHTTHVRQRIGVLCT
jgi:hypothetical protein